MRAFEYFDGTEWRVNAIAIAEASEKCADPRAAANRLGHGIWNGQTKTVSSIKDCRNRDSAMSAWNESAVACLRSTVFQILAQAGYIENTRALTLQTVHIAQEILRYLHGHENATCCAASR